MHFVRSRISWTSRHTRWCSASSRRANWLVCVYFILLRPINTLVNNVRFSNRLKGVISLISWSSFVIRCWVGQIRRFGSYRKLRSDPFFAITNRSSFEILTCYTMSSMLRRFWLRKWSLVSCSAWLTLMFLLIFSECWLSCVVCWTSVLFLLVFLNLFILKCVLTWEGNWVFWLPYTWCLRISREVVRSWYSRKSQLRLRWFFSDVLNFLILTLQCLKYLTSFCLLGSLCQ